MIRLFVDDQLVACGPDWMRHHFIEDALSFFSDPDVEIFIEEVPEK